MHHGDFQRIEAAWRTRELVVDRVDFRENIRVEFLNVSKEDLILDMEDSGFQARHGAFAASTTGLVKRLTQTWSGGVCHSIVVGEYEFGHDANDPALRTCIAEARRRRVARSPSSS